MLNELYYIDYYILVFIYVRLVVRLLFFERCKRMTDNQLNHLPYPLYMVHYPLIYLYFGWVKKENLTFAEAWPEALALVIGSIVLAYISLKLYDEPVRRYLTKRFLQVRK